MQYYKFSGKENVIDDIYNDLIICPPGKELKDKYYVGFFDGEILLAVMDLYDGYPDKKTAYIGFFMISREYQRNKIGTEIISTLFQYLKSAGFEKVQLGYEKENPQSGHFWKKNQFKNIAEVSQDGIVIVAAERCLKQ